MTIDTKVQDEKTIKLRASMIRKKMYERHPLGSAVRSFDRATGTLRHRNFSCRGIEHTVQRTKITSLELDRSAPISRDVVASASKLTQENEPMTSAFQPWSLNSVQKSYVH